MIDLFYPYVPQSAIDEVNATLKSRFIGQGGRVDRFEKDFEAKFDVRYAVSLNSGTSALDTAYELAGITNGDEVITTPLTCTATNISLLRMGAKLVWGDIKADTLCLDKQDVLRKITSKTKAVVNVHLGGVDNSFGDMPVPVISDSCQALGVFDGDYTCCSFQAIKHITTGDGGMLVVNNEQDYRKAKLMRWFGIDREKKIAANWQAYKQRAMTFDIETLGYKRQMTDIAAGMGIAGLREYDKVIEHRKHLFQMYERLLCGMDGIKVVNGKRNTYWLFTILADRRDDLVRVLFNAGIDTNLVQIRNDIFKIFGGQRQDLPVMNFVEDKYISLPLNMKTTEDNVEYIVNTIRKGW